MFAFSAPNIAGFQYAAYFASEAKLLNVNMLIIFQGGQNRLLEESDTDRLGGIAFKPVFCVYGPVPGKNTSWVQGFFRS